MTRRATLLLIGGLGLGGGACSADASVVDKGCNAEHACPSGYTCVQPAGRCAKSPCAESADCPNGYGCRATACAQLCNHDTECGGAQTCADGLCTSVAEPECTDAAECDVLASSCPETSTAFCVAGQCGVTLCGLGRPCDHGDDCVSGLCECADAACTALSCSAVPCDCMFNADGDSTCDGSLDRGEVDARKTCGIKADGSNRTCNGLGGCHQRLGEICFSKYQCEPNGGVSYCVDGVCCDRACNGNCDTCADDSAPGTCMAATNGCGAGCGRCSPDTVAGNFKCQADPSLCGTLCTTCALNAAGTTFTCQYDALADTDCASGRECSARAALPADACVDTTWDGAVRLGQSGDDADSPRVAVSASGDAMVVWHEAYATGGGTTYNTVWARRYRGADATWVAVSALQGASDSTDMPQVVIDKNGNAMTVWHQWDLPSGERVAARRFHASLSPAGWQDIKVVGVSGGSASATEISVGGDDDGNVLAVWRETVTSGAAKIRASYYDQTPTPPATPQWATAVSLLTPGPTTPAALGPVVKMSPSGKAIALWAEHGSTNWELKMRRFGPPAAGGDPAWDASVVTVRDSGIPNATANVSCELDVAVDDSGGGWAVWSWKNGATVPRIVYGCALGAFGCLAVPPVTLDTIATPAPLLRPRIAGHPNDGHATAVWVGVGASATTFDVFAKRHQTSGGWDAAATELTKTSGEVLSLAVAMDRMGQSTAVWIQSISGVYNVYARRAPPNGDWSLIPNPVNLDAGSAPALAAVVAAAGPSTNSNADNNLAFAAWRQFDSRRYSIYANRFGR